MARSIYIKVLFATLFLLTTCLGAAVSQQQPNFPYSALGVGEFDLNAQGMLSGMGYGVSAVRSSNFLNNTNPAGYSALADKLVLGELSTLGRSASLQSGSSTGKSSDFNLSRFALGIKVAKWWGTSIGFLPVSRVDYQIVTDRSVSGTNQTFNSIYEGNGGLHEFYWGNGFRIGKHFSVGAQLNYIFGSINQIEKVGYDINTPILSSNQQTYLRNFNLNYGLQYYTNLSKKLYMSVALGYQGSRDLDATYDLTVFEGSDTLDSHASKKSYFTIPDQYRAGIAFTYNNSLTVDFDYIQEQWGGMPTDNANVVLKDSHAYGLGLQWVPAGGKETYKDNIFNRMLFQAGGNYNDTYLQISGQPIHDFSISFGAGLYSKSRNLSFSAGFAVGQKGAASSNFMTENYTNFYFSLILRNIWFVRQKYY